jgi:hypothetical protein
LVQVLEHYGAALGAEGPYQDALKAKIKVDNPGLSDAEYRTRTTMAAKKKAITIGFLKRADRRRYGGLWSKLENLFTRGQDHYPEDLTSAHNLLLNYKAPPAAQQGRRGQSRDEEEVTGLTFLQNGAPVPGTDGTLHEQIRCYNCQSLGHNASVCPQENQEQGGVQLLQATHETIDDNADEYVSEFTFLNVQPHEFSFQQNDVRFDIIPSTWVLLDSQSTVSVFKNRKLLTNIYTSRSKLRVHTNGGVQVSSQKGTVKNFGDVWYNSDSLANILSMAAVRKTCRITMDTSVEAAMNVHRKERRLHYEIPRVQIGTILL